jgi:hypothetical protein
MIFGIFFIGGIIVICLEVCILGFNKLFMVFITGFFVNIARAITFNFIDHMAYMNAYFNSMHF